MSTNRVNKVNQLFQEELAESIRKRINIQFSGVLASVTGVSATPDLSIAKVYISVFPTDKTQDVFQAIQEDNPYYRNEIARGAASKMRKIPELNFYLDKSMERAEGIDKALRGESENPIL